MDRITLPLPSTAKVVVIGLGYVGLPLAMAFTKKFRVLGYDISSQRVDDLKQGIDVTNEFSASELELSDIFLSKLKKIATPINQAMVLILGYSFKENCNDMRNTKVHDLALDLKTKVQEVAVFDPVIDTLAASQVNDIDFISSPEYKYYDGIILAVAHNNFQELGVDNIRSFCQDGGIIYDLKHLLPADQVDLRL